MLNPGTQVITFIPPNQFSVDRLHKVPSSTGLTQFAQSGCNLQSVTVKDKVDNTAYAEATDKVYTPYNTNISGVFAEWYCQDSIGNSYRIIGALNAPDQWGRYYQGLFLLKKETG